VGLVEEEEGTLTMRTLDKEERMMKISASGWRKSRKARVCAFCREPIAEGQRYFRGCVESGRNPTFCDESCYGQAAWRDQV
jgi:hypothetical protein